MKSTLLNITIMPYTGVLGAATSGIFGTLTTTLNNRYAEQREAAARAENFEYNEKAADNADARTRALYHDLYSPKAQMQQIKDAGLSPSIYASGGIAGKSGASGAQGTGANGISPTVFGYNGDILGGALTAAQIENIKADTDKKEAETENLGYEGELKQAQKTNLELDNLYKSETLKDNIEQAATLTKTMNEQYTKAYWEGIGEGLKVEFDKATLDDKIQIVKQEVQLDAKAILQADKNLKLTEKQIEEKENLITTRTEQIAQGWIDLQIKDAGQKASEKYMQEQIEKLNKELDLKEKQITNDLISNLISGSINALGSSLFGSLGSSAAQGILKLFSKKK